MDTITVITPDGVHHDYIAGRRAAMVYARNRARTYPGRAVQVVETDDDSEAVTTVTWDPAWPFRDGIRVQRQRQPVPA